MKRKRGGANTNCPVCGNVTRVKQVRISREDGKVYRDRECVNKKSCGVRFWTTEIIVTQEPADVRSRPESNRGVRRQAGKR